MSDTPSANPTFTERVGGKWQIPAVLLSAVLLGAAAANIRSVDRKIGIEEHLERLVRLIDRGMYVPAIDLSQRLLSWEDLDETSRGTLRLQLARATFEEAQRSLALNEASAREVIQLYEDTVKNGVDLTAADHGRVAQSYERLGQCQAAVESYERAVERAQPPGLTYRRRIIELSEYPLRVEAEEINRMLEEFIADATDSPANLVWALSRYVEALSGEERYDEAKELLETHAKRFVGTELESEYEYLTALHLWAAGEYDEAERRLRDLLNRVTVTDPVYPKAGWLLGKVVMNDGRAQRPAEAVVIFREVISSRADRLYGTASRVGVAEALAELHRHEESLAAYRQAVTDMGDLRSNRLVNRDVIRTSLTVVAERLRGEGRLEVALEFARLATSLVSMDDVELTTKYMRRLADLEAALARQYVEKARRPETEEPGATSQEALWGEARRLFDEAGENYVRLSRMNTLNEELASSAMWTAATLFDEGGNHQRAIEVLRVFVDERPDAAITPRVLLRLGSSLQSAGRFAEAVEIYQRNCSQFPRSPHANGSLVPLAECFMAMGSEYGDQAENALLMIVEDSEIFTPQAAEYRDAMFLLGTLRCRERRFEQAIPILSEAIKNYPDDQRVLQVRFLLADAYRQSALDIKTKEIPNPERIGEVKHLRAEMNRRLAEAAERFHRLVELIEGRDEAELTELDRVYLRDARLYEADCLFALGRHAEALSLYERAAWIYKDSPVALGAYVQIINCYVLLGRDEEALRALRRAQYLVGAIPDAAFASVGGFESQESWERYFEWVSQILVEGVQIAHQERTPNE